MTTNEIQPTTAGDDIERLLKESSIEYKRSRVDLTQIDKEQSLQNQARFLSLHDDVVLTYAAAMEQGDVFPPVVLHKQKNGKYVVLDGNHRVSAANLVGYVETTAFVVEKIAPAQAELFTYAANARHGLPTTTEERVNQGMFLVARGNRPKEVAKALSIPETALYRAMASRRGSERLIRVGVKADKLADSMVRRLDAIASNTVLLPAAELVMKASLRSDEVSALVSEINKGESEKDQLQTIESWKNRHSGRLRSTSGGKVTLPANVNRIKNLGRMARNIEISSLNTEIGGLDESVAADIKRELYESIAHLVAASEAVRA